MSKAGHVPVRMCLGCRKRREKGELVRFTYGIDGVIGTDTGKHPAGRGFYLCRDPLCLEKARKKHRSMRFTVPREGGQGSAGVIPSPDRSGLKEERE